MLDIEAKVVDDILTGRPFIGPKKKHFKESAKKKKRENKVWGNDVLKARGERGRSGEADIR